MTIFIFLSTVFLAVLSGRTTAIAARGGMHTTNTPSEIGIGFVGMLAGYCALICGFFLFDWYFPIVTFIGVSLGVGLLVTRSLFLIFAQAVAFMDALVIAGAVFLLVQVVG